ncbi:rhomboid family intramembrane serine protease [Akkermansiaceae bacterium]|nr:rhomboid family intramembrane serine protease [Akkermansiaceae bacterium]MDA7888686.1 rhomboid family intramembrane serine protease [Akkermansiaceae bacterium]
MMILVGAIVFFTSLDWIYGLDGWQAVPGEIKAAFNELRAGQISFDAVSELLSCLGCAFLHGDLDHLIGNMLFFWIFGAVILELTGWRWLLVIFVITSVGATIGQVMQDPDSMIPMVGASGAVMGFEGAYLGMVVRKSRPDPHVWPMSHAIPPSHLAAIGVIGVAMDMQGIYGNTPDGIAYGAHVGGFVTGIFVSFLRRD